MSPEMANLYLKTLKKEEVDYSKDLVSYATDFYSLGILALEMLNGSPPFGYFRKYTD
jgi:serine/threonine protein kinase